MDSPVFAIREGALELMNLSLTVHRIGIREINSFNRNSRLPTSMYLEWSWGEILLKSTSPTPITRLS